VILFLRPSSQQVIELTAQYVVTETVSARIPVPDPLVPSLLAPNLPVLAEN